MASQQQGDVRLFQTDDGGEIQVESGIVAMDGGLETAVYLSLFGGNEDDDGRPSNLATWWGNIDEQLPERRYRSETQNLLRALPATSGNLRRVEDAGNRDLAWLIEQNVASSVSVSASVIGLNRVKITINVEAVGIPSRFEFLENWKASA
jgi:phage gp46-like protein